MKKTSAIFFLLIFFVFQYGKMIDYMECRIAAVVTNTSDCGCDDTLVAAVNDNANQPPLNHQHHLKNYTEEFFQHTSLTAEPLHITSIKKFAPLNQQQEIDMAYSFFQPPRI